MQRVFYVEMQVEVKKGDQIITCESCARILKKKNKAKPPPERDPPQKSFIFG